jgi:hypothetical protein
LEYLPPLDFWKEICQKERDVVKGFLIRSSFEVWNDWRKRMLEQKPRLVKILGLK